MRTQTFHSAARGRSSESVRGRREDAPTGFRRTAAVMLGLALVASSLSAQWTRRETGPRIPPVESVESINLIQTLSHHPPLMEAWGPFGGYILRGSTLPDRDREMVILRTAWLNEAEYEWGHHARAARAAGMTDEEIRNVAVGENAGPWTSFERYLLRAATELHRRSAISERTWAFLKARYSDQQMIDLIFTVGQYRMVSMALRSIRVELDEGLEPFPEDVPRR